jgi:activator of HSP90 ATPase
MPQEATRPPVSSPSHRHVGIARPAQEGFEFLATDPDFELLDGNVSRRLEQLEEEPKAGQTPSWKRTAAT